jgi:hypothetical protein
MARAENLNPVSLSIVNFESKLAWESAYDATCTGVYFEAELYYNAACRFCTQLEEQVNCARQAFERQHRFLSSVRNGKIRT